MRYVSAAIIVLSALISAGEASGDELRTVRGVDSGRSLKGRGEACSMAVLKAYRGHCWTDQGERLIQVRFPNLAGGSACTCNTPTPGQPWLCQVEYENECSRAGSGPRASVESYFDTTRAGSCTHARTLAARSQCVVPTSLRVGLQTSPCHCEQHKAAGTWQCFVFRLETCRAKPRVAAVVGGKPKRAPARIEEKASPTPPRGNPASGKPLATLRLGLNASTTVVADHRGYLLGLGADLSLYYWFSHRIGQEIHAAARFAGGLGTYGGAELDGTTWFRRRIGARIGAVTQVATANDDAEPETSVRKTSPLVGVSTALVLRPRAVAIASVGHAGGLFVDVRIERGAWSLHGMHRRFSEDGVAASMTGLMLGYRGWAGYKRRKRPKL